MWFEKKEVEEVVVEEVVNVVKSDDGWIKVEVKCGCRKMMEEFTGIIIGSIRVVIADRRRKELKKIVGE